MRSGKHYKKLTLSDGRKRDEHRVIMEHMMGRKLDFNEIVHHKDEVKTNNSEGNLAIMSRSEHGKIHAAKRVYGSSFSEKMRAIGIETMPNAKLEESEVKAIRKLYDFGMSKSELASYLDLPKSTIGDIINRKTWKHI